MLSTTMRRKTFLGATNESLTKQGFATSTPIKKNSLKQVGIEFSPVEKNCPDTHDNCVSKLSNVQEISTPNNINDKLESKKAKQFIVMSSDEEDLWQNRNKVIIKGQSMRYKNNESSTDTLRQSKRKQTQKQIETVKTKLSVDKTVTIESQNHGIMLPKINVNSNKDVPSLEKVVKKSTPPVSLSAEEKKKKNLKSALKISKNFERDESLKDFSRRTIVKPLKESVKKTSEDDRNAVRKSNRKRFKPLEYWNGERIEIDRDLSSTSVKNKKNSVKRKAKTIQSTEIELEQSHEISENTLNLENVNTRKASLSKRTETNSERSILKSRISTRSRSNVRFSVIGSGTTIEGPTGKSNLKPDWVINFPGLHSAREMLPDSENCVVLPGLNTVMGIISSAVMQICPKSINQNQTPDHHHLMYCVMVGTVTVTIDETSVRMETYGHFTVPCRVSYSIENIGEQKAILSFFKVACSCTINN